MVKQQRNNVGEMVFTTLVFGSAASVILLMGLIIVVLLVHALPAILRFGLAVLWTNQWLPIDQVFGMWPFIVGTVISSGIGVLFAAVVGTATAIVIVRIRLKWLRQLSAALVQWLSLIPSVVFGLWGIKFVAPILLQMLRSAPISAVSGSAEADGILLAGLTLAAMLLPTIVTVTRETLISVPPSIVDGALALGATLNEATLSIVIPYARRGIFSAILLALGRALGETIAVVMVIGSQPQLAYTLFTKTDTLTSVIATQWNHTQSVYGQSVLFEAGLLLFVLTFAFYTIARMYVPRSVAAARLQLW